MPAANNCGDGKDGKKWRRASYPSMTCAVPLLFSSPSERLRQQTSLAKRRRAPDNQQGWTIRGQRLDNQKTEVGNQRRAFDNQQEKRYNQQRPSSDSKTIVTRHQQNLTIHKTISEKNNRQMMTTNRQTNKACKQLTKQDISQAAPDNRQTMTINPNRR